MQKIIISNTDGETITLSNQAPYFLEKLEGAGEVAVAVESQKAPHQDGSTYMDNTLENRYLTLEGTIVTRGDEKAVKEARGKMQRVLNPKAGEVVVRYQDKEITALAESTPVFPGGQGNKGLFYQKFLLHLVCHQPFWLDTVAKTQPMAAWLGGLVFPMEIDPSMSFEETGDVVLIHNNGDVATPVEMEFNGPALNPKIENMTTGEYLRISRELQEGDKLLINTAFGEKKVVLIHKTGGEENAFHWLDLESVFWSLKVGSNAVKYSADEGQEDATVLIKWQEMFVGV